MTKHTIGIIGRGFVGKATGLLFSRANVLYYDKDQTLCEPEGLTIDQLVEQCECIFVCVPTPMSSTTGECNLSIVRSVKQDIDDAVSRLGVRSPDVILRSTVPPTTSEGLGWHFMPEFLTEANWKTDTLYAENLFLGVNSHACDVTVFFLQMQKLVKDCTAPLPLTTFPGTRTLQCGSTTGMEMFKMFTNSFLALKVGFCNEFYRYAEALGESGLYDQVCSLLSFERRVGTSHLKVPGPDGKFGFGGTCFPKDISSLHHEMRKSGVEAPITAAVIHRNNNIDRPEKDWKEDVGRAYL